ncbi:MAG: hypothetical protein FJ216_08510 [Ignavibacteria bacterium]|nr:hypothetical protein [Ignavibacteria bacterium]
MKKKIIYSIFIFILLTPLWLFLFWSFSPYKTINVLILDKTVLTPSGNEHRSFNWVLTHFKYVNHSKNLYDVSKDYYGFFPKDNYEYEIFDFGNFADKQLDSLSNVYDMAYYTDTYGIYTQEWFAKKNLGDRSSLIYGGLTNREVYFLQKMKEKQKLIICEFNFFATPTKKRIKDKAGDMFGIEWTGWILKYFKSLDTNINKDIPAWVISLYKQQNNGVWPFSKPGIVFAHEDERIVILEDKTNLIEEAPYIISGENSIKRFGIRDKIPYPYWIEITYNKGPNNVVSEFHIYPNSSGDSLMKKYGIPTIFPAVLEHYDDYKFYYFAGDFADNPLGHMYTAKFKWIELLTPLTFRKSDIEDRNYFFWKYYLPMMNTILNNYMKHS